jgi:hypothetical protein
MPAPSNAVGPASDDVVIRPKLHQGDSATKRVNEDQEARSHRRHLLRRLRVGRLLQGTVVARLRGFAPKGGAIGVLVLLGMGAMRLLTGRTFSGMGQDVSDFLYGGLEDTARGKMDARAFMEAKPDVLAHMGKGHIRAVHADLAAMYSREHEGRRKFLGDRTYQVNEFSDMIFLRFQEAFQAAWKAANGDASVRAAGEAGAQAVSRSRK